MKAVFRYFAQGLIVLVPVSITVLVLYKAFSWFREMFTGIDVIVHPYIDPFIYLLLGLAFIFLVGMLASNVFANFFIQEAGKLLEKIPVFRTIFSPLKDFTSAFIGNNKKFNHPVLVSTNKNSGIREIGFITSDDLTELSISKDFVAVYFPMSYAISGRLLIVPRENVETLNVPASEAMKFIVSGGVSDVD
ncbi:MAG: DUF502 domain-containing protein [Bacteroidia bacterium]